MMNSKRISLIVCLTVCALIFSPGVILAADYPTREIEMISAYAPGSNTDNFARVAARFGEKHLGKPIVVINKPPAAKGFTALANAKPDGYTIGGIANSTIGQQYLLKGTTFNYRTSYRVISRIDYSAEGLFVKKGGPWDIPFKELIKKVKDNPGMIKCGIGGAWTAQDMTRAIFEMEVGVKFNRINFPGAAEVIPALLGGHVDVVFAPASEWSHLSKAGKITVMAISQEKRDPRHPDIPTFREQGIDLVHMAIHWIAAPAKTPDYVIDTLAAAFKKGFAEKEFMDACSALGSTGAWEGPEDSLKSMDLLHAQIKRVIDKYGLKPQ